MFWSKPKPKAQVTTVPVGPFYYYVNRGTIQPHAGAASFAFEPTRALPIQNIFGNTLLYPNRRLLSGPPLVAQPATTVNGLGGIVQGQYVLQPLLTQGGI